MASTLHLLGVLLAFLPFVTSQCPSKCFCLAGYVTCSNLKSIPETFPSDTQSLSIKDINIEELPADVFNTMPSLQSIEIYQGSIGRISSGAFRSLTDLELISLNELTIGSIEPYAFSDIVNIGVISIYMSKIGTIQPYAFWDLFALDEIKLFSLDIQEIQSFAFSNIDELFHFSFYTNNVKSMQPYAFSNFTNGHKLSLYLNNFGSLGCGSLESLVMEVYEHSFYSNSLNCSCDITWLATDENLSNFRFSNWCKIPDSGESIFWENISIESLECFEEEAEQCQPADVYEMMVEDYIDPSLHYDIATSDSLVPAEPIVSSTTLSYTSISESTPSTTEEVRTTVSTSTSHPVSKPEPADDSFEKLFESSQTELSEILFDKSSNSYILSNRTKLVTFTPFTNAKTETKKYSNMPTSNKATTTRLQESQKSSSNPKIVISKDAEVIKEVESNEMESNRIKPQIVSYGEQDDDNGSTAINAPISLVYFIAFVIAMF